MMALGGPAVRVTVSGRPMRLTERGESAVLVALGLLPCAVVTAAVLAGQVLGR